MLNWAKDYPAYASMGYDEIMRFVSRSNQLKNWVTNIEAEFNLINIAPAWFIKSGFSPADWTKHIDTYNAILKHNSEKNSKIADESRIYREKCDKISYDHKVAVDALKIDPIVQIACVTFEDLDQKTILESMDLSKVSVNNNISPKAKYELDAVEKFKTYLCKELRTKRNDFKLPDYLFKPVK